MSVPPQGDFPQQGGFPQQGNYPPQGAFPQGNYPPQGGFPPQGNMPAPSGAPGWNAYPPGSLPYVEQNFGPVVTFSQRILASLLDELYTFLVAIPMIAGIVGFTVSSPKDCYDYTSASGSRTVRCEITEWVPAMTVWAILTFVGAVAVIVFAWWNRFVRAGRTGQSLGKQQMGLMLIDQVSGAPIGWKRAFGRDFVQGLVNNFFFLGYLWMLWDSNRQTLGDKTVNSTVIRVPKKR